MDIGAAAELLAAANRGEVAPEAAQPTPAVPENNPAAVPAPDTTGVTPDAGTTPEDSFAPGIDPMTLPPELQAIYRNMQSHFTRTQQSLREKEASLDGMNVEEARGALDFVNALNTDPQFAMSVHQSLTEGLQAAGMTPQEAHYAATEAINSETEQYAPDDTDYGSVPPDVLQRLERAEQFMQTQEEAQMRASYEAELTRQEMAIRQGHPEWDDADISTVYGLAYSHGGDLNKAADAYVAEQARWATRFLASKSSVPSGQPGATSHGEAPVEAPADMNAATAAALESFQRAFE
jgi:hypothetical protein